MIAIEIAKKKNYIIAGGAKKSFALFISSKKIWQERKLNFLVDASIWQNMLKYSCFLFVGFVVEDTRRKRLTINCVFFVISKIKMKD